MFLSFRHIKKLRKHINLMEILCIFAENKTLRQ
jgi:hypothetical protein